MGRKTVLKQRFAARGYAIGGEEHLPVNDRVILVPFAVY